MKSKYIEVRNICVLDKVFESYVIRINNIYRSAPPQLLDNQADQIRV
jgi:hypothetical protein